MFHGSFISWIIGIFHASLGGVLEIIGCYSFIRLGLTTSRTLWMMMMMAFEKEDTTLLYKVLMSQFGRCGWAHQHPRKVRAVENFQLY
jgi:hypothetical protein